MLSQHLKNLVPIAIMLFLCGLLLSGLAMNPDATALAKLATANSSPKVYGLVDIGKGVKRVSHDYHRDGARAWFTEEGLWCYFRNTQGAKFKVVRAQKNPRAWLNKNVHAEYVGNTDILRVWLTDGSLAEQGVIVNVIMRIYLQESERNWIPLLKQNIASCERIFADSFKSMVADESELVGLNNVFPSDPAEQVHVMDQRDLLARCLAVEKKRLMESSAVITEDEAALRTIPRILKWADQTRPAK